MKKSTFGLDQNIASLCCYVGGFITGIIFLVSEKDDKTVRFHALQSILWSLLLVALHVAAAIIGVVIGWIPLLGGLVTGLISTILFLITFGSWAFLMFMAYSNKEFKIPVLGDVAKNQVEKN